MAHFAKLDENNIVTQVIVIHNNELLDENGQESEEKGIVFCQSLFDGNWVQTSYNATFRKNFAGIGFFYDEKLDAFIPPKPCNSWILDDETGKWNAPIPQPEPEEGIIWVWNEEELSWKRESKNQSS